jgi:hypothetical protein
MLIKLSIRKVIELLRNLGTPEKLVSPLVIGIQSIPELRRCQESEIPDHTRDSAGISKWLASPLDI